MWSACTVANVKEMPILLRQEGRAPANFTVLTSFIGGAQDPGVLSLTNDELVAQVHKDTVQALLTSDAPLPKVLSVKMWARAIPQYNL